MQKKRMKRSYYKLEIETRSQNLSTKTQQIPKFKRLPFYECESKKQKIRNVIPEQVISKLSIKINNSLVIEIMD